VCVSVRVHVCVFLLCQKVRVHGLLTDFRWATMCYALGEVMLLIINNFTLFILVSCGPV
jgi:hypothetical protein